MRLVFGVLIFIGVVLFLWSGQEAALKEVKESAQSEESASTTEESVFRSEIPQGGEVARVARVIDGDTIELESGERVRYIGIDTPESVHPDRPDECFGAESAARNRELVEGKEVVLVRDVSERDKYGRLLRYVYAGGVFVNELLLKEGYAQVTTYPPDVAHVETYLAAQREAREAGRGLWGGCPQGVPDDAAPSAECNIKGNISTEGEKIYHIPVCEYYSRTVITESKGERWFCSEEEALAAGWRKALNCN